jgi:hypothetical protein
MRYFDALNPVGSAYGLFVPREQPSNEFFVVLKVGDYDGRTLLIRRNGRICPAASTS